MLLVNNLLLTLGLDLLDEHIDVAEFPGKN